MPQINHNKVKLLKLMEILNRETDVDHQISRRDLLARLLDEGIDCDIRTLSKDIKVLNEYGYEVMSEKRNNEKFYYVSDRTFDIPEIKILIDAVQAAKFIPEKKSVELIRKLTALGGSHQAEIMESSIVHFNTKKHTNGSIYYSIDTLENAIQNDRKVIFRYFDLDENGKRVYRKEGHHYVAEPVALVFNEDNYYLICYSSKHRNTANYRVDRMDSVEIVDETITLAAKKKRDKVADITESAFKMYGGPMKEIRLEFDDSLIGVVYDKFGEDTAMKRIDGHTVSTRVKIQESPTFRGWLAQFDGKMKVTSR